MAVQRLQEKPMSWTSSKNKFMKKINSSRQDALYVAINQKIKHSFYGPSKPNLYICVHQINVI
jgi:hypothetical protein